MDYKERLAALFAQWSGQKPHTIIELPLSGSSRRYVRLIGDKAKAIGAYNTDYKENVAFLTFTRHFLKQGIRGPEIYAEDLKNNVYLLQDLGDETLYATMVANRDGDTLAPNVLQLYKQVIKDLPHIQVEGGKGLDYTCCYPRADFDKQSMLWDLNMFKYYFLKLAHINFDEQALENDFVTLADYLLQTDCSHFMYRDFQARNVMLFDGVPYYIDYQGGRRGALQYDLASFLYSAKSNLPQALREELLQVYIKELRSLLPVNEQEFTTFYYGYVYIRLMQTMGAYGFRGFYERKEYFLKSIPFAIQNLRFLMANHRLPIALPTLQSVWEQIVASEQLNQLGVESPRLTVHINSFSYKKGIPCDTSGNGGGFVFDCRALPNPGRYEEYKKLTGQSPEVKAFLENKAEVLQFTSHVYALAEQAVQNYLQRHFTHLSINFGCTGGQHRSVYFAEKLAALLKEKFDVDIQLSHTNQEGWER